MTRAWRAWVALMDRKEPATALALVRIGASVVLLADLLWVGHEGLVRALWGAGPDGFALAEPRFGAVGLWTIGVVALACIALGLATRVACLVYLFVSVQMALVAPDAESGLDTLLRIVFPILALSRCNARWSLDAVIARRLGRPMPDEVPAWPRYLLLLQLVWVYFSGGQNKSSGDWGPLGGFTALAQALSDPHAARFDPGWIATAMPITRIATALTMAFELCAPIYLLWLYYSATPEQPGRLRRWSNRLRLRWIWLGLGVSLELGIALTLRLGSFPFGMLALYPVLLQPEELRWKRAA